MTAQVYSIKDAAAQLGCSVSTIYTFVNEGKLQARQLLSRTVITADEIARFVRDLPPAELGRSPLKGKPRKGNPRRGSRSRSEAAAA